ncbi:MAG: DNA translocase FtsK 4TM domain-containing protein [Candidatus Moranbacteria bacterium]|nr:DNA translocase FtsK 4TM domain-containing protein [Candidatus Moranbacteria bacterium]
MGRKKKKIEEKELEEETEGSSLSLDLSADTKRSITAVVLATLAIIIVLGFVNVGGVLGEMSNKGMHTVFGWGKWLAPIMLIFWAIILFKRKGRTVFYVARIAGVFIMFIALLGILDLVTPKVTLSEPVIMDELIDINGETAVIQQETGRIETPKSFGGVVGHTIASLLVTYTGKIGAPIIFLALLFAGALAAFNVSLVHMWAMIVEKEKEDKEAQEDTNGDIPTKEENDEMEGGTEETVGEPQKDDQQQAEEEKNKDEEENIKNIVFVEEPFATETRKNSIKKAIEKKEEEKDDDEWEDDDESKEWVFPPPRLLQRTTEIAKAGDVNNNADIIKETFGHFGIDVELAEIKTGPTVTQYSFRPAVGVKLSKITSLGNDLALALAATSVRIEAPIPGRSLIGIEVPNKTIAKVGLRELVEDVVFNDMATPLAIALGKDVSGANVIGNIAKMPHLMIAGSTGTGKSVSINTILLSLLYKNSPEDLRLILVDPKRVELTLYNKIPHLLGDVVVDNVKVVNTLKWAIGEMEKRYRLLQKTGSRDIASYNQKAANGETYREVNPKTGVTMEKDIKKIPYIVIVIDELADLMASHGKEVEAAIIRLAQMARAIGIHLIVSTQRPSVEVITGLIKANITTRIALKVATQIDSRTILDMSGAEKLVGSGDMLFVSASTAKPQRVQGAFVSEEEVKKVIGFIKKHNKKKREGGFENDGEEEGDEESQSLEEFQNDTNGEGDHRGDSTDDELYEEAKKIVIESKRASTSYLQRRLRIGYSRAARLVDLLEKNGIVGPADGSKARTILAGAESVFEEIPDEDVIGDDEDIEAGEYDEKGYR